MSQTFRRRLARRLLEIAAAAAPLVAGCGSSTEGCEPGLGDPLAVCFSTPDAGAGCPTGDEATADIVAAAVAIEPAFTGFLELENGPTVMNGECCYTIREKFLCVGRPYVVAERALAAPARRGAEGWADAESLLPRLEHLGPEARAALAAAWARDGLFEHASVASFGRFALELLAVGAPAELVELAHRAALDEIRHARLCLGLAAAYAGEPVAPSAFPFGGRVEVTGDLADVAARTAREGCIEETRAALDAADRFAGAGDPAVRAVLANIAEDEARHAQLAWRTIAWAVRTGGERVRAQVAVALDCADPSLADVVAPAARALLG